MTNPIIRIHNTATDEVIDREMTDAEYADYQADQELQGNREAEAEAKAANKAALLNRLGITEAEARLLLS